MLEERIKIANFGGVDKVSYIIRSGRPVDEIVRESEVEIFK